MSTITERAGGDAAKPAEDPAIAIVRQYFKQLAALLPSHVVPAAWYAGVHAALYKNDKLLQCANTNPESLIFALYDAARQGLEPGTPAYYLTPRNNKRAKGGKEVLGIRGYQGEIELIYRAGAVSNVIVSVVRRDEHFQFQRGLDAFPDHRVEWGKRKKSRGDIYLAYGYCKMVDGSFSHVVVLDEDDIERAKRASGTANYAGSTTFWNDPDDVEAMWLKTVVHRLQKFVPTSSELLRVNAEVKANAAAHAAVSGQARAAELGQADQAALPAGSPPKATGSAAGEEDRDDGAPSTEVIDGEVVEPLDPRQFAQPPAPGDPVDDMPIPDAQDPAEPAAKADVSNAVELVTTFEPMALKGDEAPATAPQTNAVRTILRKGGITDEGQHLGIAARLVGHGGPLAAWDRLTKPEAGRIIDLLRDWQDAKILPQQLRAVSDVVAVEWTPEPAEATS